MKVLKNNLVKVIFMFIAIVSMGNVNICAKDILFMNDIESVAEFSRGKIFPNGISCEERFKCFREEITQDNGKMNYHRTVEISKIYKKNSKGDLKILASCSARIISSYDKENLVKVEKYCYDIKNSDISEKWSLMGIGEVVPQEKNCLLSTKCSLYKVSLSGVHNYVTDGHFDILCSCDGSIGINTDIHR